jgi:hypothetical protein
LPVRTLAGRLSEWVCDSQVQCANKLSVRVVFTVTAICLFQVADCLGVIWSSLTGN